MDDKKQAGLDKEAKKKEAYRILWADYFRSLVKHWKIRGEIKWEISEAQRESEIKSSETKRYVKNVFIKER